jgi:hypothetical protein
VATVRRIARWGHFIVVSLYLIGIVVQFFLAGVGFFTGEGFGTHNDVGWAIHFVPVLALLLALLAWLRRVDIGLTLLLAVLGFVQPLLAEEGDWAGAFHPLNALVLFFLGHHITGRAWRTLRMRELPRTTTPAAVPGNPPG